MAKQERGKAGPADGTGGGGARLNRDIQLKIGEGLRAMYDDVVKQGVPDRFVDLLAEFDQQGGGGTEKDSRQK